MPISFEDIVFLKEGITAKYLVPFAIIILFLLKCAEGSAI